jgi:hypothetical protein
MTQVICTLFVLTVTSPLKLQTRPPCRLDQKASMMPACQCPDPRPVHSLTEIVIGLCIPIGVFLIICIQMVDKFPHRDIFDLKSIDMADIFPIGKFQCHLSSSATSFEKSASSRASLSRSWLAPRASGLDSWSNWKAAKARLILAKRSQF